MPRRAFSHAFSPTPAAEERIKCPAERLRIAERNLGGAEGAIRDHDSALGNGPNADVPGMHDVCGLRICWGRHEFSYDETRWTKCPEHWEHTCGDCTAFCGGRAAPVCTQCATWDAKGLCDKCGEGASDSADRREAWPRPTTARAHRESKRNPPTEARTNTTTTTTRNLRGHPRGRTRPRGRGI